MRLVLVGATGAVGTEVLSILEQRSFPVDELVPVASPRSAGRMLPFRDREWEVVTLSPEVFDGADLAIFDVDDPISKEWVPIAAKRAGMVIDKSAAWRMDPEVPLIVPEVNPQEVNNAARRIIANPNCTTLAMVVPLAALHRRFGVNRLVLASYQAASGSGRAGTEELWDQLEVTSKEPDLTQQGRAGDFLEGGETFVHPIAMNVVPRCGSVKEDGYTSEELKLLYETRKIMGLPDLRATATCVRVPVVTGHGVAVHAEFDKPVDLEEARRALSEASGVVLQDDVNSDVYPTPLQAAGEDACYVGRLRRDLMDPNALEFFCVADNLRKGAALNAVQIAELLLP
jgi:aspartate-semialdehyde dehydrogenase